MHDLPLPTFPVVGLVSAAEPRRSLRRRHPPPVERAAEAARFEVGWARDDDEFREAQRLRQLVFADAMGARLTPPHPAPPGRDIDLFDPFCEHLLVRAPGGEGEPGRVIGAYPVLTPATPGGSAGRRVGGSAGRRVGGLCSDNGFDPTRLRPQRDRTVELGRSCVHPAWRSGSVILALCGALAELRHRNELDTVLGCASVGMRDGGHFGASLREQLRHTPPGADRVAGVAVAGAAGG